MSPTLPDSMLVLEYIIFIQCCLYSLQNIQCFILTILKVYVLFSSNVFFSSCILYTPISQCVERIVNINRTLWRSLHPSETSALVGFKGCAASHPPLFLTHPQSVWVLIGNLWELPLLGVKGGGWIKGWHFAALCQWLQTNNGDDDGGSCWRINRRIVYVYMCVCVHMYGCSHPRACATMGLHVRQEWLDQGALIYHNNASNLWTSNTSAPSCW